MFSISTDLNRHIYELIFNQITVNRYIPNQNPLHFGEGFSSDLQTQIKHDKKTTKMANMQYRRLMREVYIKGVANTIFLAYYTFH